jgi:hypothetical protein
LSQDPTEDIRFLKAGYKVFFDSPERIRTSVPRVLLSPNMVSLRPFFGDPEPGILGR